MELNFKLTYNIPKELIKALNITNDTIFCAYYCDGKLYVETVDDNCPFFCHACGTCNKDWEDEEDE